ncbi:Conserved DNA-binding protein YbaB [Actinopolyspora alba]|uniref:Conserved DNA-binding protein YbaB n=1 Tax=Actinopolyspora alba TaxID=673379 RepID=A0A1I1Z448_9ACTN|nr:YbaB/EbfC family nucleoid-associated protein [Actinopolyspora alba]SFE26489.1 Conserved DNA-binding protein YbaB [Actinopolyspora alba]
MSTPSDPDEMLAGFRQQIQDKMQQAQRIQDAASAVSGEASSGDGSVRVTVDQNGNMSDLRLEDGALRQRPEQLSEAILTTVRSAQAQLTDRMREAMEPVLGEDSETMDSVLSGMRDRFPVEPEQGGAASTRGGQDSGEEQYDEYDWLNQRRR